MSTLEEALAALENHQRAFDTDLEQIDRSSSGDRVGLFSSIRNAWLGRKSALSPN